jgi:hypothetical protein
MAVYQVVQWRNIPLVVEAQDGAGTASCALSERFQMLVDSAAMQLGLEGSEEYLAQWGKSAPTERAGTAQDVADTIARELEDRFPEFIGQAFHRP